MDFVASLSYTTIELESDEPGENIDGNGFITSTGVRAKPVETIELGASVNYADIPGDNEVSYALSARFFATPTISIGLELSSTDDMDGFSLGTRFDL